ncbi:MAG: hypothetical protein ACFFKA_04875, partial [Candidatus Thorarchaeota archaeon]
METLIEEKIQRQNVRTVPGTPYNLRETLKWFAKHSVYDLFYPLTLLAFLLIAINTIEWYYTLIYLIIISVGLGFLFFIWIETHLIKIPSIGSCFENKWWQEKFNDLDEIIADIGFVGDIMKIKDYRLFFNNSIKEFFHNVDLMVGNLEGIIKESKPAHFLQQKHKSTILNYLKGITDTNPQWLLCVSNNHGADFKKADFKLSYEYINKIPSFSSFGSIDHQNFIFRDEINIVSGTIWNNFSNNYLAQFADRNQFFKKGKFNILFPHWHYENECYVRNDLYYKAISLLITGFYFPIHKLKSKLILIRRSKFYKNFKEMPIILG